VLVEARRSTLASLPPLSVAGIHPLGQEAAYLGGNEVVLRSTMRTALLLRFDGRKAGFCKLIVDRNSCKILGCHVVGERAVEIAQVAGIAISVEIAQVAGIAISAEMRVDDFARIPLSFPNYIGILTNVAAGAARQLGLKIGWQVQQAQTPRH
jgi:pyruvate/2-oxoglutarate dehydrogenase complex dihydrolipoamide dehydrogenase (E3) component